MVTGTTGDDEITLTGQSGDVTVDLLAGDDILHVPDNWSSVNATASIHGDDGYDTLDLSGRFLSATGSGFAGQVVTQYNGVTLTDNWDGIESVRIYGADISTSHSFVTGDSDDSIVLLPSQNGQTVDITTNGGDDSVTLAENISTGTYYSGTIDVGAGNDTVDLRAVRQNSAVADAFDIFGGSGDDSLRGSAGPDTLYGGADDDSYYVRWDQADTVVELAGEGDDSVYTDGNYTLGANVENLFFLDLVTSGSDHYPSFFTGNALDNHIVGSVGTTIDGGAGADVMENGNVYYVDNVGDVVVETDVHVLNVDTVYSSVTYTIGDNIEILRLTGSEAIDGTGNGGDNEIFGNSAVNTLTGGAGDDRLIGGLGNDTLIGGDGDDYYEIEQSGDVVVELGGPTDFDKVLSRVASYTLTSNVEVLTLVSGVAFRGTGNDRHNIIETQANHDDNVIDGGAGADTMRGGGGDDTYVVDDPFDLILDEVAKSIDADAGTDKIYSSASSYTMPKNVEIMILTGTANINATGSEIANTIDGNSGNNVIDGSFGADTMRGGKGDDTYYVDNPGDIAYEGSAINGNDTVFSTISYTIGSSIETLVLLGTGNTSATGNNSANHLVGNSGNNVIDGRIGADTMEGGLGNDTYYADYSGDVVIEASGGGTDTVRSSYYYHTLGANVENLVLVAGSIARNGTGNNLANTIDGNELANVLDGMGGADTMRGGNGDDTYQVDNAGDKAVEGSGAGHDTVNSSVSFALSANVEDLILTGGANINGVGNDDANLLQGNSGNNTLDGRGGGDVMKGGLGNDGYYVDSALDQVVENANAGTDVVRSSASSHTLSANVENLVLIGSAVTGIGNGLANILYGNALANDLDGRSGADEMRGLDGDDTYHVDYSGDVVVEGSGAGNDTVLTSVSYALAANVEVLTLTGSGGLNGTGNSGANTINGNGGNNRLYGLGGDDVLRGAGGVDTLIGGLGNDTLEGGSGTDSFLFDTALNSNTNVDSISDFVIADDTILLDSGIFTQAGPVGTLDPGAFRLGGFAQDVDDRILYDPGSGNIFYDADGSGAGTALWFAHVTPGLVLSAADFLIVP